MIGSELDRFLNLLDAAVGILNMQQGAIAEMHVRFGGISLQKLFELPVRGNVVELHGGRHGIADTVDKLALGFRNLRRQPRTPQPRDAGSRDDLRSLLVYPRQIGKYSDGFFEATGLTE